MMPKLWRNHRTIAATAADRVAQPVRPALAALLFVVFFGGAFVCTRYLYYTVAVYANSYQGHQMIKYALLNCSRANLSQTCPVNDSPPGIPFPGKALTTCPDYFRWIHEDLWPWKKTGITREMVMAARPRANFRLVIFRGKAYVETYRKAYQTRDTLTLWGILQLLRRYPGKIPDLDLMFHCGDEPVVPRAGYGESEAPPALFRYCGNDTTVSIVFPDWSFWGWPDINIKPWEILARELQEGNLRLKWKDREPAAYWKGNPEVSLVRHRMLNCNASYGRDYWNARIYVQDWIKEQKEGFKESDLANQCTHRYKIYVQGRSWSVSQKYIMACDSMTLLVRQHYYDFFSRALEPLKHYWPVRADHGLCRSIKLGVDWGNTNQQAAQAIGKAGSRFILEEVKMEYVYDYMFHVLSEYSKLLMYKPTVPNNAQELCSELMACNVEEELTKKCMMDTLVRGPASSQPCGMPPPYSPASFRSTKATMYNELVRVAAWEEDYWQRYYNNQQV